MSQIRHFRQNGVSTTQKIDFKTLKEIALFSEFKEEFAEEIINSDLLFFNTLKSGEDLIVKNSLIVVKSGLLEAYKTENEKNIFLKKIFPGEITGLATLFDRKNQYISTLRAKKDSKILTVKEDAVLYALKNDPDFSEKFAKLLCDKLRFLNGKIDAYTQTSVEQKLIEYIKHSPFACNNRPYIEMSMLSLSSALGVGRASLYRVLATLETSEVILREGKKIYLLSEGSL